LPDALAMRSVIGFAPTSTIRLAPESSKWEINDMQWDRKSRKWARRISSESMVAELKSQRRLCEGKHSVKLTAVDY
jgi:hypothetical protein